MTSIQKISQWWYIMFGIIIMIAWYCVFLCCIDQRSALEKTWTSSWPVWSAWKLLRSSTPPCYSRSVYVASMSAWKKASHVGHIIHSDTANISTDSSTCNHAVYNASILLEITSMRKETRRCLSWLSWLLTLLSIHFAFRAVVYRQGDIGTSWYAVLSGSLDVKVSETANHQVKRCTFSALECVLWGIPVLLDIVYI